MDDIWIYTPGIGILIYTDIYTHIVLPSKDPPCLRFQQAFKLSWGTSCMAVPIEHSGPLAIALASMANAILDFTSGTAMIFYLTFDTAYKKHLVVYTYDHVHGESLVNLPPDPPQKKEKHKTPRTTPLLKRRNKTLISEGGLLGGQDDQSS